MSTRLVKLFAIAALPVAGIMVWSEFNWANLLAFIGAFSTAIAASHVESRHAVPTAPHVAIQPATVSANTVVTHPRYADLIGKRLKNIREKTLKMTLREMTEFLGLESVTELERHESGDEEFPLSLVRRIEEFFFLADNHCTTAGATINFKSFHLDRKNVTCFIAQGFRPMLICDPSNRGDLLCYLVFSKREQGFMRLVTADRPGSFASNGGGRLNIQDLISPMLEANLSKNDVSILTATAAEWQALRDNCFYDRHPFRRFGSADWECTNIFDQWFEESAESRARWENIESEPYQRSQPPNNPERT